MTDPTSAQSQRPVDLASLRDLVADALSAVAGALLLASGVLALLILVASGWLSMHAWGMRSDRR
jgi:hypothetical protein